MKGGRVFFLKKISKDEFEEILKGNLKEFLKFILPIISVDKKSIPHTIFFTKKVLFKSRFDQGKFFTLNKNLLRNRYKEFYDFSDDKEV